MRNVHKYFQLKFYQMKKSKKLLSILFLAMFSLVSIGTSAAELLAAEGGKSVILTRCVVRSTGETVGYANNCGSGSGNCIDHSC
jgi:hypothetical protein